MAGIAAVLVYVIANVASPIRFDGYDWVSQTVSELSAIDSPTRGLWTAFMIPFTVLLCLFGVGVWLSAGGSRALRASAFCMIAHAIFGFFWPPMHLRGVETTLTDTLHIVWTAVAVPLMIAQIVLAAVALDRRFRTYSVVTIVVMIGFSVLTSLYAPNLPVNGPTPFIGLWERIGMAAYFVWVAVFAVKMLQRGEDELEGLR
jgi:hypothetical protein